MKMACCHYNYDVAVRKTRIVLLVLILLILTISIINTPNVIYRISDSNYDQTETTTTSNNNTYFQENNNSDEVLSLKSLKFILIIHILIIVICLVGFVGVLITHFWITIIFTIGLAIVWTLTFVKFEIFLEFSVTHFLIIGTFISVGFFIKFLRKQRLKAQGTSVNSQVCETTVTTVSVVPSSTTTSIAPSSTTIPTTTIPVATQQNIQQSNGQMISNENYLNPVNCLNFSQFSEPPPAYESVYFQSQNYHANSYPDGPSMTSDHEILQLQTFNNNLQNQINVNSRHQIYSHQDIQSQLEVHHPSFYKY